MHQLTHLAGDLHRQRLARAGQQCPAQPLLARRRATGRARWIPAAQFAQLEREHDTLILAA